jgi:hypothetical protein
MIVERGGCSSTKKAIYVLKQTPLGKIIPSIYAMMFSGILKDSVHHHVLPRESIFYHGGGEFPKMQFGEEGSRDKFPKE